MLIGVEAGKFSERVKAAVQLDSRNLVEIAAHLSFGKSKLSDICNGKCPLVQLSELQEIEKVLGADLGLDDLLDCQSQFE